MAETLGTARLTLTVDTTEFAAQIQRSRSLASGLGTDAQAAFAQAQGGAKRASESLLRYVQAIGNGVDEQKLLNAAIKGVPIQVIEEARQAILRQRDATAAAADEQRRLAQAATQAAAAQAQAARVTAERSNFIASLQAQVTAIGKTKSELLELRAAELGVSAAAAPMIQALRAEEAALAATSRQAKVATTEFNQYGLSQKQVVAAMRQVPAQITDIFVSLQGGQNPLTVLLQQGGQLRDIFGGAVPAIRALGGALMGLVNPYTVAAAAVGLLLAAIIKSENRINAFNEALIMSGEAGRTTAADLQASAAALDEISGVTSNSAAEALTRVVATGKIAANQYELVAAAATRMRDATGKAIDETVAEYADIARDPVNALLRLNEAENFATAALIRRVRELQEAGQIEQAAAVATEARAQAQIERAAQVVESLGLVTGAWHSVKNGIAEAWDESSNFFTDLDRDAKEAVGTLGRLWQAWRQGGVGGAFAAQAALAPAPDTSISDAQKKISAEAERQLSQIVQGNLSREEQQRREIVRIRNLGVQAGWDEKRVQDAIAASNKKYQDSLPKGRNNDTSLANAQRQADLQAIRDAAAQERAVVDNQSRMLQAQYSARLVSQEEYYAQQRQLVERNTQIEAGALQKQIDYLKARDDKGKASIDVIRQIGQLEAQLAKTRADGATALAILGVQEEQASRKRAQAIDAYNDSLQRANDAAKAGYDAAILRITLGEREAEIAQKLADIQRDAAEKQRELARDFAENNDQQLYEERLSALQEYVDEQTRIVREGYDAMAAAQANWLNGVRAGVQDWITRTSDVASQMRNFTESTLQGASQTMATFFKTGKADLKGYLADVAGQLADFFAKQAVMNFVKMFAGAFSGGATSGMNVSGQAYTGAGAGFAKGGAFANAHPSLSAYSGKVVNQPTPFYFAKGGAMGVMGEAGHEGILPLERTSDGRLGVLAAGGGGAGGVTVNVTTIVQSDGSARSQVTTQGEDNAQYAEFGRIMQAVAQREVLRATEPGGVLWKAGVGMSQ